MSHHGDRRFVAQEQDRIVFWLLEGIWNATAIMGIAWNAYPRPSGAKLPLLWYDRILRRIGPLLPFSVLLVRAINDFREPTRHARRQLYRVLLVYLGITIARLLIYGLHVYLESVTKSTGFDHLLSDHLVLGASMTAILQSEMAFLIRQPPKKSNGGVHWIALLLWTMGLILGTALFGLTCGDMFYTVRYFHPRKQSIAAYLIGNAFHFVTWQTVKTF